MTKKDIKLVVIFGIPVVFVFIVMSIFGLPFLDATERGLYESVLELTTQGDRKKAGVLLVQIDDKSLQELGPLPWHRKHLAEAVSILDSGGANVIGLAVPLNGMNAHEGLEQIRTFRERLETYSQVKAQDPFKKWILENLTQVESALDYDQGLINSVGSSGKVVLPVITRTDHDSGKDSQEDRAALYKNSLARRGIALSHLERRKVTGLMMPFPGLTQAAAGLGHADLTAGKGRGCIFHPLFVSYEGALIPSFPLRMAIAVLQKEPGQVVIEEDGIRLGDYTLPAIKGEMAILSTQKGRSFARASFVDILHSQVPPKLMEGKAVIIGFGGGASGSYSTSALEDSPDELTAHLLNNMLNGTVSARPSWFLYLEILILLLVGCFGFLYFPKANNRIRLMWTGLLGFLILIMGMAVLTQMNMWFRTIYAVVCLVFVYLIFLVMDRLRLRGGARDADATNRLLGLSFQSQGLLDLAFDKFKKLPMDLESMNLIYNLGQEFEEKGMVEKALSAYEYLAACGKFRDIEERIPRLRRSEKSSTTGGTQLGLTRESLSAHSGIEGRSKVGRYEIIEELGKGAMGLVYKALDPTINRLLAIKTIRFSDEFEEDVAQEIKGRFFTEAEIAGQLSHPSIVTIYDIGEDGDLIYMVMEYIEGEDLENFVNRRHLLPLRKVLDVVAGVADALDYAHGAGVIHRDIKPANIMILKTGGIKVTDFGIAKAISSSRTKTGVILGTPNYMSPEQIMGQKIDHRSDIFSLGVLFFQLLTGETPFHGDNLSSLLYQITQVKHPPVRHYNPKIPRVCEQLIDKALCKDPKARFKSAREMEKYVSLFATKIDQLKKKSEA